MDSVRVLHVDDEPGFGELVSEFLEVEDEALDVAVELNAADALETLRDPTESVDCIVSDYDMPRMDGLELLAAVRADYPDVPFILYTGKGSEAVASEAMSSGATDYLQKGSGTEQYELLANRVRNAVEQFRSRRRAEEGERIIHVIRDLNRALVYADSVDEIERKVCRVFGDAESYEAACIAGVGTEKLRVEPRTWTEGAGDYFEELNMVIEADATGREAPGGRAFHEREIAVSQDVRNDPAYEDWREDATEQGFASLAVAPLEYEAEFYGLLAVFGDRTGIFDDRERDLLVEASDDIAYAMHAEETRSELRETASRLEALFERSPDMINVHDMDGNIRNPNPRLCEQTGYDESTLTEMRVWDLDTTLDPATMSRQWSQMAVGDTRRLSGEYERADGSTFPVEVHVRRLDLGGSDRFVAISRDVSDRRERKRELRRYENIVENLPVGVFRSTPAGDFVDVNPAFVSLFGGESPRDFADVSPRDLWADSAERAALIERLNDAGVVENETVRMQTLDGDRTWIEATIRLTEADGSRYLEGIVRDVSERREREQRLEQAETMFEHALDALFLVDVGEEFTVERVNPVYEAASGFGSEAVRGKTQREILGEQAGAEVEARYRECVDRREPLQYEEALPIDDETTYWETRIAPVVVDGDVEKLVGATREIGAKTDLDTVDDDSRRLG